MHCQHVACIVIMCKHGQHATCTPLPRADFLAPCRTNKYPREVPQLPWYRTAVPQMLMAGFLPFSAIYVELYYIFASVWGHKVGWQERGRCQGAGQQALRKRFVTSQLRR